TQARHHVGFVLNDQDSRHISRSSNFAVLIGDFVTVLMDATASSFTRAHAEAALPLVPSRSTGSVMVNLLPAPGVLSTEISPPCARAMCCTSDSPNPLPFVL